MILLGSQTEPEGPLLSTKNLGNTVLHGPFSFVPADLPIHVASGSVRHTNHQTSTVALGGAVFSKLPLSKTTNLYTNIHLAIVPFAGSSVGPVSDTAQYRDYRFGYGLEGKIETSLNLGKYATISLLYDYYFIHSFNNTGWNELPNGTLGNNFIHILKPKITLALFNNISFGVEHDLYFNDHYQQNLKS